jgi:hypothetical protein
LFLKQILSILWHDSKGFMECWSMKGDLTLSDLAYLQLRQSVIELEATFILGLNCLNIAGIPSVPADAYRSYRLSVISMKLNKLYYFFSR